MYDSFEMPEDIEDFITRGINMGKRKKRNSRKKRLAGVIICLALTVFIAGIRVSPVLAANVAKIPGLRYIVELVRFDKGLTSAIDNDYIQKIGKSCEKSGLVLTVKDIIADNSGIIIFYSIENKGNYKWPHINEAKLLDANGETLKMSSSYGYGPNDEISYDGKIDFHFVNEPINGKQEIIELPEKVILQTKMAVNSAATVDDDKRPTADSSLPASDNNSENVLDQVWKVEIPVDKTKFSEQEKLYKIDKVVEVENQKILFEDIKIYPTKSILTVSFDKANSRKIFSFEDLKLVDENGQEWGRINNGMIGTYPSEYSQALYFQSNYFYKPKELYITGNSIRALDKEECYFMVDIEKKQITYSPYNLLSISEFNLAGKRLTFRTRVKKDQEDITNSYDISHEVSDANGNQIEIVSSGMGSTEKESFIYYDLKLNDNFKGPITFKIHDYPSKIKDEFKINIQLD